MKISVIIPTLNCEKTIGKLLKRLKYQTQKADEIIVVDSESNDKTVEIAEKEGAKVLRIRRKEFDHGKTRNLAVENAKGDIIVFLSQDALPYDKYLIQNIIKPLETGDIIAAYGRQIVDEKAKPTEFFARNFNYPKIEIIKSKEDIGKLGIKTFFFSNVCSAIKKEGFEQVGGFPSKIIMNEDMFIAAKFILSGYKIAYVPDAKVIHYHNYTIWEQFKRNFDIGVFFADNNWILRYARAEDEGFKYFKEQLRFLWKEKKEWILYGILENIFRYAGYRLGLNHKYIPLSIKLFLSMNENYWLEEN
ncbi:MAG TPA: glycosyltransferase [Thermoanaerobacter sp.]|nr:glycosyltransferase [Thermoanaerobacter sp.]